MGTSLKDLNNWVVLKSDEIEQEKDWAELVGKDKTATISSGLTSCEFNHPIKKRLSISR